MKCVKVNLQDRSKMKSSKASIEKPRRFCQLRMVNPDHEVDPRWTDAHDRFHCIYLQNNELNEINNSGSQQCKEDLVLSVQNLQFNGNVNQDKKVRSNFKYKTLSDSQKHRMFVKQIVEDFIENTVTQSSELSFYNDDYTKYIPIKDLSRPSSGNSSIILFHLTNKYKENKCAQVNMKNHELKKKTKAEMKSKLNKNTKSSLNIALRDNVDTEDTKISFYKNGKRKSLTISRAQSPATVQVIRVEVVCNRNGSTPSSGYETSAELTFLNNGHLENKENQINAYQKSRLAKKYRLTNTVKTLEENVSGSKVTLMCKTFKLSDRSDAFLDRKQKL